MANSPGTCDATVTVKKAKAWEERRDKLNPMTINLVVANVCKYLNLQELKICRSLNQQWKKEAEKYFLKCWPPLQLSHYDSRYRISISQFIEIYDDPNHVHPNSDIYRRYQNFHVSELETEVHAQEFNNFLSKVGDKMTSLKLSRMRVCRDSQDLYHLLNSKYTPKLEELSLDGIGVFKTPGSLEETAIDFQFRHSDVLKNTNLRRLYINQPYFQSLYQNVSWLDVLSIYPNLTKLGISELSIDHFEEIATALVTLRQDDDKKLSLTKLEWTVLDYCSIREIDSDLRITGKRIFKILEAAHLPLEYLELSEIFDHDAFVNFLQAHKGTLKTLDLSCEFPHPFPRLEALKHVKTFLDHFEGRKFDFRFLSQVPNLTSIQTDFSACEYVPVIFPAGIPIPIESLKVFDDSWAWCEHKTWNVTKLDQLFAWLPNIKVLKMDLDNDTFSCVCEKLPNLRDLTVLGDLLEDSAVIGESTKIEGGNKVKERRHGITNLIELEKFVMEGSPSKLTEKSVLRGFALMPRLKTLEIGIAEELTFAAKLALKTRIQKVTLNGRRLKQLM